MGSRSMLLLLCACGRLGFDERTGNGDDAAPIDAIDAGVADAAPMDTVATPQLNDTCPTALDVTTGGTFIGDTCGADDSVATVCAPTGTRDVFYTADVPQNKSMQFELSSGFELKIFNKQCDTTEGTCSPVAHLNLTAATRTYIYAIERANGSCGSFMVKFTPN